MSKSVTCNTLVWLLDAQFEAGTTFHVVESPDKPREVDPTTAAAWQRNGWLAASGAKAKAAGEGA